jgi:hypothetical protein
LACAVRTLHHSLQSVHAMVSVDNLMFSDETMDFIKEEIEEKIDKDDNFLPSSSTVIFGGETQRLDDNLCTIPSFCTQLSWFYYMRV